QPRDQAGEVDRGGARHRPGAAAAAEGGRGNRGSDPQVRQGRGAGPRQQALTTASRSWQAPEKWRGCATFQLRRGAARWYNVGSSRHRPAGLPLRVDRLPVDPKRDRGRTGVTKNMTKKSDIIEAVAGKAGLSRADATSAVDAVFDTISSSLGRGDSVAIAGFGTFEVRERAARTGRNPRTGEEIQIPAAKNPAFKAGKALKEAVN